MIVPMKHLDLVCLASEKEKTLETLRALGVLHLDFSTASGQEVVAAKGDVADAERAVRLILKARGKSDDYDIRPHSVSDVLAIEADRQTLLAEKERLEREIRFFEPYGDFDPDLAVRLKDRVQGLEDVVTLPPRMPEMRLARLREKLARVENRVGIDTAKLAQTDEKAILASYPELADRVAFAAAKELMAEKGALAVISGWVPQPLVSKVMEQVVGKSGETLFDRAAKPGWGVLWRDPAAGETPPTLIEPPKLFRPVKVLFEGLGVSPAYTEADVSVPFLCYFALFFAMLVGDGAYGAIFLGATLALRKKLPRSWFVLLSVFSAATVVWGVLSNTWFGAQLPFLAALPTVTWLGDPSYNNMMLLCFTIGVSHLMLARIWNGICRLPDTTAIAEFGWAGVLLMMYLVTNAIVGIFPAFPSWGLWLGGVSIAAVFLFSVKPSELKTRGAELGMLPLSIMSALGDIISYVRLFAVGLASVKVAENFNNMAVGLVQGDDAWWAKALLSVAMVAILIFGHVLNLMMAGLSILVHAVRLNTLEFSNHKGITWSGFAFRPFARNHRP